MITISFWNFIYALACDEVGELGLRCLLNKCSFKKNGMFLNAAVKINDYDIKKRINASYYLRTAQINENCGDFENGRNIF